LIASCCRDFLNDIGAITKSGFRYVVTLHPPKIYSRKDPLWGWELKPHYLYRSLVLNGKYVLGLRQVLDWETNEWYDGFLYDEKLYIPASAVYDAVVNAIAKYALARFLGIRRARPFELNVTVSFASTR